MNNNSYLINFSFSASASICSKYAGNCKTKNNIKIILLIMPRLWLLIFNITVGHYSPVWSFDMETDIVLTLQSKNERKGSSCFNDVFIALWLLSRYKDFQLKNMDKSKLCSAALVLNFDLNNYIIVLANLAQYFYVDKDSPVMPS